MQTTNYNRDRGAEIGYSDFHKTIAKRMVLDFLQSRVDMLVSDEYNATNEYIRSFVSKENNELNLKTFANHMMDQLKFQVLEELTDLTCETRLKAIEFDRDGLIRDIDLWVDFKD